MHNTKFKNRPVVCPPPAPYPRGEGAGGGYAAYIATPPGRLLRHTQHDALAQLVRRLALAEGPEGPQPSGSGHGRGGGQGHFSFLAASGVSSLEAPGTSLGVELSS